MAGRTKTCPWSSPEGERKPAAHGPRAPLPRATYSVNFRFSLFVLLLPMTFFFGSSGATVVPELPLIEPAQEYIVVEGGGNLTLTCRGKRPVQWMIDNNSTTPNGYSDMDETKEMPYTAVLHLVHLNYTDVSFFGCTYLYWNASVDLNSPLVSRIYVFVKDESHLLVSGMEDYPTFSNYTGLPIFVPCKPTFPEVKVVIKHAYNDMEIEVLTELQSRFGDNDVPLGFNIKHLLSSADRSCSFNGGGRSLQG